MVLALQVRTAAVDPQEIFMLTRNSAACAVFLHLLGQLKIKSIAIGGLPGGKPMQAIGGTKGDQAASAEIVQNYVQMLVELGAIADTESAKDILPGLIPLPLGNITGSVRREYGINTRNHLLPNDTVPSMMRFEPADCHVYYTPENVADVQQMWRDAVDIAWNRKACVGGSIHANISGSGLPTSAAKTGKGMENVVGFCLLVAGIVLYSF